ncbi:MAG: hypothetical protein SCG72_03430 [Nitrosarchaeum sp.]|nr:hypothetical protein [Nitrosarchaeum sp.]
MKAFTVNLEIMTEKEQDENFKKSLDLIEKWGEENKSPTLYKIIHDELGYSHDCTAEIIDAVEKWLPKEDPRPSYATMQWDKCVRMMREKLE